MIHFGTGGWRAVIADEFTKANIQLLCRGLADKLLSEGAKPDVVIGYDRRFLSKESAHWAAEVFAKANIHVRMVDRSSPTPLIMYAVKEFGLDYGLAVTASHNPAIYNGIKVFTTGGRDASLEVTRDIESRIARFSELPAAALGYDEAMRLGLIEEINPINDYIDSILALIDGEAIKKARLRVALDPMYGVSQTSLRTILMTTRCELDVIHDRHDTLFGGRLPAPNEDTLAALQEFVTEHHSNIGLATDGDADRIGVIDNLGRFVHPNALMVLLYYYLVQYRGWKGAVVRNNSTTHLLDRVASFYGETCYEVPVGFKYVSAKMDETDAILGGESSGGLAVRGHIRGKDGIYAASLLVEMLAVTGKPLSELYAEITEKFGRLYGADANAVMTPERKEELKTLLLTERRLPDFPNAIRRVSYEDGCKVYFANGSWVIARFSGTEPLLRLAAEAETQADADGSIVIFKRFLSL